MCRGPAATARGRFWTATAGAYSSTKSMLPAAKLAAATGSVHMNATATVAPAGPQYMRALERANQVRLARADLKRRVAMGELDVGEVILECPWEAESMAVADLLLSQRRWGQTRCRKFLSQIPMSETTTIG